MEQTRWAGYTAEELSGILIVGTTTAVLFWYMAAPGASRITNSIGGGLIALLAMALGLKVLN